MEVRRVAEVTGRDRRRFQRIRTAWPVILESADGRVGVGQVLDTSLSGMRIATDLDLEPETPLVLRITLPKDTGRLEMLVKIRIGAFQNGNAVMDFSAICHTDEYFRSVQLCMNETGQAIPNRGAEEI